jgi:hypothetical protein
LKKSFVKLKTVLKLRKSKQKKGVPLPASCLICNFALGYYLTNNKWEQNEEATKTNTEHPYNLFLLMTKQNSHFRLSK